MDQNKSHWLFFIILLCACGMSACKKESVFQQKAKPETTIIVNDSRLSEINIHFSKDTVYILSTNLSIDSGQQLSIDAGTLIKVNNKLSITIQPGAQIDANGTSNEPIVFTSSAFQGGVGKLVNNGNSGGTNYWYGIRMLGRASIPERSSGVMRYVRVEFAGGDDNFAISSSLMFQYLSPATTLENIQVSYSFGTPSFEFFGGNCNGRNLLSYASGGSDFYLHGGYTGKLQNLLAYRHPDFPATNTATVIQLAGLYLEDQLTFPTISNLTVLGPGTQKGTSNSYLQKFASPASRVGSLVTTGGASFHIRNAVFFGFPKTGWLLDDGTTAASIDHGISDYTYSAIQCNDSTRVFYLKPGSYPPYNSLDFKNYMLRDSFVNRQYLTVDDFMLTDPYNYDIAPNPIPKAASPLLTGANFDGIYEDAFFNKVEYIGALGVDNWMLGWSNYLPLQTNYNN